MKQKKIIINKTKFNIIVERLSHQLIENHADFQDSVLIGIQPRGTHLCKRIHNKLTSIISNSNIKVGNLDITFYRDDFRRRKDPLEPQTMDIDFSIEGKHVILIDDVLYTGRTVRAALDEIFSYGRPKRIRLGVLVDRGHREIPIKADFVGKNLPTSDNEHIHVSITEVDGKDKVFLEKESNK